MSLATLKEVLEIAERTNTAIPGFNIDNIEIPEAIMEAAEAENCPVILTIGQGAINAGGLRHLPDVVRRIAESSRVPVVMHLDHSESYEQVIACLRAGFTSVMYDGSHYPFEENVRESQAVVRAAHAVGVSVECELGAISGVEDGISHSNTNLVDLDEVKRFIAQQDLNAETRFVPEKVIPKVDGEFEEKIAIIGGGPAGLSCAYYLAEKGYRPTVFEKEKQPGGMLMHGIPEFRLEKDVIEAEIDVLRALGVEFRCGVEVGRDVTIPELREQGYKGFYVAIGLQSGGKLGVPGEDAEGVKAGIELMREVNLEGKKELSGRVVVIGGGNIGADVARTALRCGAEKVSLYCLEDYDSMPMGVEDRTECEEDGIEIHAGWGQTEILAENGRCSGIRFRKCLSVRNAEGRFAPTFDDNTTEEVPCDMVLYCIGQKVDWKGLLTGTAVELNPNGTAKADPVTYQTAEPDLFVGGDVYTGQKFAIDAIAAGKQGAVSLHRWVQDATLTIGRDKREFIELDKNNLLLEEASYDNTPRQRIGYNETLRKTFKDGRVAFTEEQVKAETARCLGCGASVVDPNKCIGCGICTTRCAFDAIHLHRDLPECSTMRSAEDKMKGILPYMIKRKIRIRRAKKAEKRNG